MTLTPSHSLGFFSFPPSPLVLTRIRTASGVISREQGGLGLVSVVMNHGGERVSSCTVSILSFPNDSASIPPYVIMVIYRHLGVSESTRGGRGAKGAVTWHGADWIGLDF